MIFDSIYNLDAYTDRHAGLIDAYQFLTSTDLAALPEGTHQIKGKDVFAIVETCQGKGKQAARLEAHRLYIDVQHCITGKDSIGIRPLGDCHNECQAYDAERDICFFSDSIHEWIEIGGELCVVLFPENAHAPLASQESMKKIVVKIRV